MLRILIRKIAGLGRSNFGIGKRTDRGIQVFHTVVANSSVKLFSPRGKVSGMSVERCWRTSIYTNFIIKYYLIAELIFKYR